MQRRKSEGRTALGTHIIPEKVLRRVHLEKQKEKELKLKEAKETKVQRPVSAQPRFNRDIQEVMEGEVQNKEEEKEEKERKKVVYQNWIKAHFENQQKNERDRRVAEMDEKKAKEMKLKALD